jgi:trans-aconitate methyltransferase
MQIDGLDTIRLTQFYEESLRKYGPESAHALQWKNRKSQQVRFAALSQVASLTGKSVLDVGCGVGDLYKYLQDSFGRVEYCGLDVVPGMIVAAKQKYPGVRFVHANVLDFTEQYDYVLASGALTYNMDGGKELYFKIIKHMYAIAKKGVAFNVLDNDVYATDHEYLTYSYVEIAALCETLNCQFVVFTEYEVGDFTVFLYK